MKKIQLIVSLCFLSFMSFSQVTPPPIGEAARENVKEIGDNNNITGIVKSFDNRYEGIKGSPYHFNFWSKANVAMNNTLYENIQVKYNVLENNLLFKDNKGKLMVLDAERINYFIISDSISNNSRVYKKLGDISKVDDKLANQFAEILYEGANLSLVKANGKHIIKANYKEGYSSGRKYDEISDNDIFFIIDKNRGIDKVRINKKSLLSALSDKEDAIKSYLNKEKIDASTEEGWIKTLAYYETL